MADRDGESVTTQRHTAEYPRSRNELAGPLHGAA
jgi:hypothetical protein